MTASDKRMGVLNELIGAVSHCAISFSSSPITTSQIKFIKYFAWEERWIDRTLEAREAELKWIIKGNAHLLDHLQLMLKFVLATAARLNNIMLGFMLSLAPIFVSVLTFTVYILNGNELTISTAFTVRLVVLIL